MNSVFDIYSNLYDIYCTNFSNFTRAYLNCIKELSNLGYTIYYRNENFNEFVELYLDNSEPYLLLLRTESNCSMNKINIIGVKHNFCVYNKSTKRNVYFGFNADYSPSFLGLVKSIIKYEV